MRLNRAALLRALGCVALLLGVVPLLALCTALFGRTPAENLPRIVWLLAAGLAGFYFHGMLQKRTAFSLMLRAVCLTGTALLCGLGALLFTGGIEGLVLGLLFAAGHLWGARFSRRPFDQLLSDRSFWSMLLVYGLFLPLPALVNNFRPIVYSQLLNAVCFLCFAAIRMLLKNQSNIDSLTASRHYSLDLLPKKIRSYNLALIGGIILLAAALFTVLCLTAPDIGELLNRLRDWLVRLLPGVKPSPEEPTVQIPPDASGVPGLPDLGQSDDSLAWLGTALKFLFGGLLVAGVAAVLLYNRSSIAASLRGLWQRIRALLAELFRRASRPRQEENADYTDFNQAVTMETRREVGARNRGREWRKAVRRYQRMADSAEKYRVGYGLTVDGLTLCGAGIRAADTPLEIAQKASELLSSGECRQAADFFDLLQYGERAYQPGRTAALDRILEEVALLKKNG